MPARKPKPYRLHLSEWLAIRRRCEAARVAALARVQATEGVKVMSFLGYTLVATNDDATFRIRAKGPSLDDMMALVQNMIDRGAKHITIGGQIVGAPDGRYLAHGLPTSSQDFSVLAWDRHEEAGEAP